MFKCPKLLQKVGNKLAVTDSSLTMQSGEVAAFTLHAQSKLSLKNSQLHKIIISSI